MNVIDLSRPIALVTGASTGIGRELALLLARDGLDLLLVARDRDRLSALAGELARGHGIRARPLAADLADPAAPHAIAAALERDGVAVDVLVNNAGFGTCGPFATSAARSQVDMVQVNVTALTHLTRLLLPSMLRRRAGRILNVASTAAFQPGPLMAVYYATKAYVLSFSEALSCELEGTGVTVTALCPGATVTEFQRRAGVAGSNLFRRTRTMDAPTVARIGYEGLKAGRRVVIAGWRNALLARVGPLVPHGLLLRLVRNLHLPAAR